ncbi:ABC transporter substrate-binding protein [Azorhizobium doebereinerae]|uniref:ABC transporter substrate-binding protein n=1 Tax=Azorhizobium doebereinerae TaxID=281091 RepID=UPI000418FD23|nr:ABC transporter substrate-binding protein [Azorhizobium doebereinerae]
MMRFASRLLRAALSVAALAMALPAVHAAAEPLVIRVGYAGVGPGGSRFVPGLAGVVGAERYLEQEFAGTPEVTVEWFYFKGAGPAVNEALASGQLDFAFMGDLPSLTARGGGLKTKILMAANARDNLYLVAPVASPIATLRDVKGRRVAQFRGTSTHLTTERVLAEAGIPRGDVQFFNMDDATALAAIATGDVDAAFGKAIFLTLVEKKIAKVVLTTKGDPSTVTSSHLLVREAFEAAYPDLTGRVVKASVKAAAWASDEVNREALFDLWAKSGTPIGVFRADYEGQTLAYRLSPLIDALFVENYRYKAAQVKQLGLVRRDVDISGWFEPKYLDAALKDLGLEGRWVRYGADGKPLGS